MSEEIADISREEIADMEQEDFDNLKKTVEETEEGEEIVLPEETPEEKVEETPEEKVEETPEEKVEETPEEKGEETPEEKVDPNKEMVDQYLSDIENKQDLANYTKEELQRIIHVQNKRLDDKDSFIDVLKVEKKQERQQLNERIHVQQKEYETRLSERPSKEELNESFIDDPVGTQEKIAQFKQEDTAAEEALNENRAQEKRLGNEEQMTVIDRRSPVSFNEVLPEVKSVLKDMGQFSEVQIEAFIKDPYLEDMDVLLDLRDKALGLRETQQSQKPEPKAETNETNKDAMEERKKLDIASKINKAHRQNVQVRGTGSKTPEANLLDNLKQTPSGRLNLSELSREELEKLNKQADELD